MNPTKLPAEVFFADTFRFVAGAIRGDRVGQKLPSLSNGSRDRARWSNTSVQLVSPPTRPLYHPKVRQHLGDIDASSRPVDRLYRRRNSRAARGGQLASSTGVRRRPRTTSSQVSAPSHPRSRNRPSRFHPYPFSQVPWPPGPVEMRCTNQFDRRSVLAGPPRDSGSGLPPRAMESRPRRGL